MQLALVMKFPRLFFVRLLVWTLAAEVGAITIPLPAPLEWTAPANAETFS
jgi:hypothetical protein